MANKVKLVDSVETLEAKIAEVREAQRIFSTYTQEQVDAIFKAAAIAANKARLPLRFGAHLQQVQECQDLRRV